MINDAANPLIKIPTKVFSVLLLTEIEIHLNSSLWKGNLWQFAVQNKYSGIAQTVDYRRLRTTEVILEVFWSIQTNSVRDNSMDGRNYFNWSTSNQHWTDE